MSEMRLGNEILWGMRFAPFPLAKSDTVFWHICFHNLLISWYTPGTIYLDYFKPKGTSYVFSGLKTAEQKDEFVEIHYGDNQCISILLDHKFPVEDRIKAIQSACKSEIRVKRGWCAIQ
jgi:hypothetical protein